MLVNNAVASYETNNSSLFNIILLILFLKSKESVILILFNGVRFKIFVIYFDSDCKVIIGRKPLCLWVFING